MALYDQIADIVAMVFRRSPEQVQQLGGDEPLATIGLDSISCMDIVVQLEELFNVTFEDEELLLDNLNSMNKLHGLVASKLGQHTLQP